MPASNVPDVHYTGLGDGETPACGQTIVHTRFNTSLQPQDVTCLDCALRVVAQLQNIQSAVLRNIAIAVAPLVKR
jgi:hypothetical protein